MSEQAMNTQAQSAQLELSVERVIKASQEKIYNAWLNPLMFAKFMLPGEGMRAKDPKVDAKVGAGFSLIMIAGEDEMLHSGEYFELTPFDVIQFSWVSPFSEEGSTVTIKLTQVDGGTKIVLHHVKFVSEESRDNHNGGWTAILENLDKLVA